MKKIIFIIIVANLLGAFGALVFVNSSYLIFSRVLMIMSIILNIYWIVLLVIHLSKKT